jgi:hypothetical protein
LGHFRSPVVKIGVFGVSRLKKPDPLDVCTASRIV